VIWRRTATCYVRPGDHAEDPDRDRRAISSAHQKLMPITLKAGNRRRTPYHVDRRASPMMLSASDHGEAKAKQGIELLPPGPTQYCA
jgi:hypothetical protein